MDEFLKKLDAELHIWRKNTHGQICKKANLVEKVYLFTRENQILKWFLDIH